MIEIICDYGRYVAVFIVFTVLCEIIMPKNKYRDYIRLVCGIFLTTIMLKPIGEIADLKVSDFTTDIDKKTLAAEYDYYSDKQKEFILKKFNENIKEQINRNDVLGGETEAEDVEVVMSEDMSEIEKMYIKIKNDDSSVEVSSDYTASIKKEILKNNISHFYNLPVDNIYLMEVYFEKDTKED